MHKLLIKSDKQNAKEAYDQLRTNYDVVSNQPGAVELVVLLHLLRIVLANEVFGYPARIVLSGLHRILPRAVGGDVARCVAVLVLRKYALDGPTVT